MTKVTFKDRQNNANIEPYCEDCCNYDKDWIMGDNIGTKMKGRNVHCKKCRYLAPSEYAPQGSPPEIEIEMSDQEIVDEHHRMKYGEY